MAWAMVPLCGSRKRALGTDAGVVEFRQASPAVADSGTPQYRNLHKCVPYKSMPNDAATSTIHSR
jgi:hypothetical protein